MKQIRQTASEPGRGEILPKIGYSMRETADMLGISYMTVFRLAQRGLLRPSKAIRTKIFSLDEIERFLRDTAK